MGKDIQQAAILGPGNLADAILGPGYPAGCHGWVIQHLPVLTSCDQDKLTKITFGIKIVLFLKYSLYQSVIVKIVHLQNKHSHVEASETRGTTALVY